LILSALEGDVQRSSMQMRKALKVRVGQRRRLRANRYRIRLDFVIVCNDKSFLCDPTGGEISQYLDRRHDFAAALVF